MEVFLLPNLRGLSKFQRKIKEKGRSAGKALFDFPYLYRTFQL